MGLSTTIPAIAINTLILILQTQLTKLIDITSLIEISINSLPFNVKCNDPRVQDIKQQLDNVKQLILNINKIKQAMNTLSKSFNVISGIAMAIEIIQLAIPAVPGVPQGPFAKLANIANALDKNCKSASKCLSSIIASIDLATSKLESVLAFAIIKLTTICTNEVFSVTLNVQDEILKLTEQSKSTSKSTTNGGPSTGVYAGYTSKFYNEYNVSSEDIESLETIIFDLNELEVSITDYLLEAPTKVYSGNVIPIPDLGKIGDFYINLSNQTLFGPKILDNVWPDTPIKY